MLAVTGAEMNAEERERAFQREVAHGGKGPDVGLSIGYGSQWSKHHRIWKPMEQAPRERKGGRRINQKIFHNNLIWCCAPIRLLRLNFLEKE